MQIRIKIINYLVLPILLVVFSGCASTPEPKPVEELVVEDDASKGEKEEVVPLTEEDRDSPGEQDKPAEETVAEVVSEEKAAPIPTEPLGEETSELLASAAQMAKSDPAGARKIVEQAAKDNPKCFQCHYNNGVLLEAEGKFDQAQAAYRKALAIHPAHIESVVNLSNLLVRLGKPQKAQSSVTAAIRAAPRDLDLRNQLAAVLLSANKRKEAADQAKGVLAVDERNVRAMLYLGQAYYSWGKLELAERILLKANNIDETNALIHNRLGFVYLAMDDKLYDITNYMILQII